MGSYQDLILWQKAMDMTVEVYKLTDSMPREELYGLVSQMRRAAVSVPSNIAEGQARRYGKEFARFLEIAHGSLAELETQTMLCVRLGYFKEEEIYPVQAYINEVGKMIRALIKRIQTKNYSHRLEEPASPNSQLLTPNS